MSTLLQDALRQSLHAEVLAALDHAESVHRGLEQSSAKILRLTDDEFQRVRGCAEQAYNALAFARTLTEWQR